MPYKSKNVEIYNTTKLKPADSKSLVPMHDLYNNESNLGVVRWKYFHAINYTKKKEIKFLTVSYYSKKKIFGLGINGFTIHPLPYPLKRKTIRKTLY